MPVYRDGVGGRKFEKEEVANDWRGLEGEERGERIRGEKSVSRSRNFLFVKVKLTTIVAFSAYP